MKLGVFDSGIGGITVLRELRRAFPAADFVYVGDTANVPYGTKSAAQVRRLAAERATLFADKGIDALVVACNTVSSLALELVRKALDPVPVLGVLEPGVRAALDAPRAMSAPVLVLATRATVTSGAYGHAIRAAAPDAHVIEQACPLLVPMIEEGWVDHPVLHQTLAEYVAPHLEAHAPGVALLGCTHYPWALAAFEKALPGWRVVNSAQAVARALGAQEIAGGRPTGHVEWIFTDPDAVPRFARELDESRVGIDITRR